MDYKGITWAGIIYRKFEAMCLEVEEVMYEDTVKYMENQVQKVGVSVKKFYSEIMQDLLPTSGVDPVKVAAGDLSLNPYAHTELKKTKQIMSFSLEELKKEIPDRNISYPIDDGSSFKGYNDIKSKRSGVYKRPINIKRISDDNHPPKVCRDVASLSKDNSHSLLNNTSEAFSGPLVSHHPVEVVNFDAPNSRGSIDSLVSDMVDSTESVMRKKQDHTYACCASQKSLSVESVRQKKDVPECTPCYDCSTIISIDKSRKDESGSHINSNGGSSACSYESEAVEVNVCFDDNFAMEIIGDEEAFEPVETCVLVEGVGDEHDFVSHGTQQNESYKKKIRKALSSKFRSERKHGRCVLGPKDRGAKNNTEAVIPAAPTMDFDEVKVSVHDSVESDWEFL